MVTESVQVLRNNSSSTNYAYNFRIEIVENSVDETQNSSNVTFKLQFNNNTQSTSRWWSGVGVTNRPKATLYVDGNNVGTGYVTTDQSYNYYIPTTAWSTIVEYTTDIFHNTDGTYTGTCGFSTQVGGGSYGGPYGPRSSNNPQYAPYELTPIEQLSVYVKLEIGWQKADGVFVKTNELTWSPVDTIFKKDDGGWK